MVEYLILKVETKLKIHTKWCQKQSIALEQRLIDGTIQDVNHDPYVPAGTWGAM